MRRFFTIVLALLLCVNLLYSQNRIVCDETCKIGAGFDSAQAKSGENYAVVSPVVRNTLKMIQQAPRLETLEGKTIAIVGESFMTHITHPELKRLILKNYPTAKVILLDEIGEAGPFPAPGVTRQRKEEFEAKLKSMHVDAVIAGNGGCGLCTPKETGSCLTAEYIGIPSVIIAGSGFADQAYYTAYNNGVPVMRVAVYPGAFATHTNEELIKNTREVLWPQIEEALTKPITQEELNRSAARDHGDFRDDVFYGTLDEVNAYFKVNNWSDGLPIIPPTFEKVNEYLKYTDYAWDEVIATLPPAHRSTTTWHVAVNAVMSGCKPEYMPILIALTKERAFANYYANPGSEKDGGEHTLREYSAHIQKTEHAAMTDTPPWYDSEAVQISTIPTMQANMTAYLITGDAARNKVQTMPGGGCATVIIELPRNWNQLMEELGYPPLKEFFIK